MQFAIVGSVSEAEASGLGRDQETEFRDQTGTLMTGVDIVTDDHGSLATWLKGFFVPRSGVCLLLRLVLQVANAHCSIKL